MACETSDLNLEEVPLDEDAGPNKSSNKAVSTTNPAEKRVTTKTDNDNTPHTSPSYSKEGNKEPVTSNVTEESHQDCGCDCEGQRKPPCTFWQWLKSFILEVDCDPKRPLVKKALPPDCRGELIADTLEETACRVEKVCNELKDRVCKLECSFKAEFEDTFANNLTRVEVKPVVCKKKLILDQAKEHLQDISRINEALRHACNKKYRECKSRARSKSPRGKPICTPPTSKRCVGKRLQSPSPISRQIKQTQTIPYSVPVRMAKCAKLTTPQCCACPPQCCACPPQSCICPPQRCTTPPRCCPPKCCSCPPKCCTCVPQCCTNYVPPYFPKINKEQCSSPRRKKPVNRVRSCHSRCQHVGRRKSLLGCKVNKSRSSHERYITLPRSACCPTSSPTPKYCSILSDSLGAQNCVLNELGYHYRRSKNGDALCKLLMSKYLTRSRDLTCFRPESASMYCAETGCASNLLAAKTSKTSKTEIPKKTSTTSNKNQSNRNNNYGEDSDNFRFFRKYLSITPSDAPVAAHDDSSTVDTNPEVSYSALQPAEQSDKEDSSSEVDLIEERISRLDRWLVQGSPEVTPATKTMKVKSPQKKKSGQGIILGSRKNSLGGKTGQRKPQTNAKSGYVGMAAREYHPFHEADNRKQQVVSSQSPARARDYRYESPKRPEIAFSDSPGSMASGPRQYTPQIFPEDVIRDTRSLSPVRSPPMKEASAQLQSTASPYKSPTRHQDASQERPAKEEIPETDIKSGPGESCVDSGGFKMYASQQPTQVDVKASDTYTDAYTTPIWCKQSSVDKLASPSESLLNAALSHIWDSKYESKLGVVRSLTGDYRLVSKHTSVDGLASPSDTILRTTISNIYDSKYEFKLALVRSLTGDYRLVSKESSVDAGLNTKESSVDVDGSNNNRADVATPTQDEYVFQAATPQESVVALDVSNNNGDEEVTPGTQTQEVNQDELKFIEGSVVTGSITTDTLTTSTAANSGHSNPAPSPAGEPPATKGAGPLMAKVTSMNLQQLLGRSHIPWCKVPASAQDVEDDVAEIKRMKAEFMKRLRERKATAAAAAVDGKSEAKPEKEQEEEGEAEKESSGEKAVEASATEELTSAILADNEETDLAGAMGTVSIQ